MGNSGANNKKVVLSERGVDYEVEVGGVKESVSRKEDDMSSME